VRSCAASASRAVIGVGTGAVSGPLFRLECRTGDAVVGERGERGFLSSKRIGGFGRGFGDFAEAPVEQGGSVAVAIERSLRLIGGAERGAARFVGLRESFARRCRGVGQFGGFRGGRIAAIAQFLNPELNLRPFGGERVEPVLALQALGRGGAVAAGNKAVPAAHHPLGGNEALPDRERLSAVGIGNCDLR
jgi:hypothetical protein